MPTGRRKGIGVGFARWSTGSSSSTCLGRIAGAESIQVRRASMCPLRLATWHARHRVRMHVGIDADVSVGSLDYFNFGWATICFDTHKEHCEKFDVNAVYHDLVAPLLKHLLDKINDGTINPESIDLTFTGMLPCVGNKRTDSRIQI